MPQLPVPAFADGRALSSGIEVKFLRTESHDMNRPTPNSSAVKV